MTARALTVLAAGLALVALTVGGSPAQPANASHQANSLPTFAQLTVNGTPLSGQTSLSSIGGVDVSTNHIELYGVEWGSSVDPTARRAQRELGPIEFSKPLDQTTPDLYRALAQNGAVAGDIKIFDTNPEDGTTRHRFTVTIGGARVVSVQSGSPDAFDHDDRGGPPYDVVQVLPATLTYTDVVNSVTYTDAP